MDITISVDEKHVEEFMAMVESLGMTSLSFTSSYPIYRQFQLALENVPAEKKTSQTPEIGTRLIGVAPELRKNGTTILTSDGQVMQWVKLYGGLRDGRWESVKPADPYGYILLHIGE